MDAQGSDSLDRFEKNLRWYSGKSSQCQAIYKSLKFAQIVIAAFIPAVSALMIEGSEARWAPIATGLLGMLVVIIEGIQTTFQPLEKWMVYRSAAEGLKRERSLFDAGAGPYDGLSTDEQRRLFVVRTEDLMSAEHAGWRLANRPIIAGAAPGNNAT